MGDRLVGEQVNAEGGVGQRDCRLQERGAGDAARDPAMTVQPTSHNTTAGEVEDRTAGDLVGSGDCLVPQPFRAEVGEAQRAAAGAARCPQRDGDELRKVGDAERGSAAQWPR